MSKGDPKKPRGKMSSYAFFVQTCREKHKKKHPDAPVNFSEFSKKCSERWKTMSAKEKGKFEDMAKADKARYEREMKTYIPRKGETKKKFKDPNAPKRPPSVFFLFCSEYRPKIKGEHPGLSMGDIAKKPGEMWNNTAADDKQPDEKKAAKLKEKYEKDIAAYRAKGKPDAAKKGVVRAEKRCKAATLTTVGDTAMASLQHLLLPETCVPGNGKGKRYDWAGTQQHPEPEGSSCYPKGISKLQPAFHGLIRPATVDPVRGSTPGT